MRKNLIVAGIIVLAASASLVGVGVATAPAGVPAPHSTIAPSVAPVQVVEQPTPSVTPEIGTALSCETDASGVQVCIESAD